MIYIFIGAISGMFTGLGLGGGSVLILFLTLFANVPQHISQATNIIFFIPSAIISILINLKHKNIKFKKAYLVIVFGILGSILGATIASRLNVFYLRKLFGVFLILISIIEFFSFFKSKKCFYGEYKNKNKV